MSLLQKSLYGLTQAPRASYQRFADFVKTIGFKQSASDHSLFIYHNGSDVAYILLYVDDILLTSSSTCLRNTIMSSLACEFAMKDLGSLDFFLGIAITRSKDCLFLSQKSYAESILEKADVSSCKPCATLVDTKGKLSSDYGTPHPDPTGHRQLVGALQYICRLASLSPYA